MINSHYHVGWCTQQSSETKSLHLGKISSFEVIRKHFKMSFSYEHFQATLYYSLNLLLHRSLKLSFITDYQIRAFGLRS